MLARAYAGARVPHLCVHSNEFAVPEPALMILKLFMAVTWRDPHVFGVVQSHERCVSVWQDAFAGQSLITNQTVAWPDFGLASPYLA